MFPRLLYRGVTMKNEVKTNELSFLGNDPGAVKFGNFINYYTFHNAQQRISKLHPQMFPKHSSNSILCLDVGCNTGELTKELHQYLKSIYLDQETHILGIDIDPKLIERAKASNNLNNVTFIAANIMEEHDVIQKYLASHGQEKFNISFCFSVTMWIHLNNGDEGLFDFLKYLKDISRVIIIEPQPWNCYREAQKRLKRSGSTFEHYKKLKIRSEVDTVIVKKLLEDNFIKEYESAMSSWKRKIFSFSRKD